MFTQGCIYIHNHIFIYPYKILYIIMCIYKHIQFCYGTRSVIYNFFLCITACRLTHRKVSWWKLSHGFYMPIFWSLDYFQHRHLLSLPPSLFTFISFRWIPIHPPFLSKDAQDIHNKKKIPARITLYSHKHNHIYIHKIGIYLGTRRLAKKSLVC